MKKRVIIVLGLVLVFIALSIGLYNYGLTCVDKKSTQKIDFVVHNGDSKIDIVNNLKDQKLVKSKLALYIYVLFNRSLNLQAGTYTLAPNMSAKEIFKKIDAGDIKQELNVMNIKFIEGKRITDYVKEIAKTLNVEEQEIYDLLSNQEYLQSLINDYWFINEDILDEDIYYPLEGYLFASTYEIYKDSSVKDVLKKMLDGMGKVLEPLKKDIEESNYSVHEILTMASIVELEGANSDDREGVAGVFYNRLNIGEGLGSDVTTYYAAQKDFSENIVNDLSNCNNGYNTRNGCNVGKLPVGPISSPSLASIKAALYPSKHDYYYFVADVNQKTYFMKTYSEHEAKVKELKTAGLWPE